TTAASFAATMAAVVNITARKSTPTAARAPAQPPQQQQPPQQRPQPPQQPPQAPHDSQPPSRGAGSGFIVEADGVILTNAHVVDGADEVTVRLLDRREFKGKVVGLDRHSDVAVVKIEAKGLPTVKLGDPSQLRVGEWVLAIGSPYGFAHTATSGIVSATARSVSNSTYVPFIQTDAAVNPGNSGGPLFNLRGEVIGINSQIYSRSGGFQGIAFAIPIDVAANVKAQLMATGKVERGRIGVTIQEVTQSLAESFGLDRPRGALISSVEAGSPAEQAGIKAGDVVLAVQGKAIERSAELPLAVAAAKPGSRAGFELWRDGQKQALEVTVGALGAPRLVVAEAPAPEAAKLGLAVRPLNDTEREKLKAEGVLVEQASGPAARAGLRQGDIVSAVNGRPVKSPEDLRAAVEKASGAVALLIKRGDQSLFVPVEPG
ncbi:MAG TPA: Do family serine endopeptidase, partial [Burkholderiales bacterium]|nr:Do family serine endopeptidase [Burkholderiales bacterium]